MNTITYTFDVYTNQFVTSISQSSVGVLLSSFYYGDYNNVVLNTIDTSVVGYSLTSLPTQSFNNSLTYSLSFGNVNANGGIVLYTASYFYPVPSTYNYSGSLYISGSVLSASLSNALVSGSVLNVLTQLKQINANNGQVTVYNNPLVTIYPVIV